MKILTSIATAGLMTILAAGSASADESWTTDLAKAKETAKADGKKILMNFTGSDWCGACQVIDGAVLSKKEFTDVASEKWVLLKLDFPRGKGQSDQLKVQNKELAEKFAIRGYPTFVVADADGKELDRSLGSPARDVEGFLAWLKDK